MTDHIDYNENWEPVEYPGIFQYLIQNLSYIKTAIKTGTTSEVIEATDGAIRLASKMNTKITKLKTQLETVEGREANLQEELGNAVVKIAELEQRPEVVNCFQCREWTETDHILQIGKCFFEETESKFTEACFYCANGKHSESEVKG